jgi:GH24 family phage-related lysozyme (muramidase)
MESQENAVRQTHLTSRYKNISDKMFLVIYYTHKLHKKPFEYSNGLSVIGYGTTTDFYDKKSVDRLTALSLLNKYLDKLCKYVNDTVKVELTQSQFDVLIHFLYDYGIKVTTRSRFMHLLLKNKNVEAASELNAWKSFKNIYDKNLAVRRDYDYNILMFNDYNIGNNNESKSRRIAFTG